MTHQNLSLGMCWKLFWATLTHYVQVCWLRCVLYMPLSEVKYSFRFILIGWLFISGRSVKRNQLGGVSRFHSLYGQAFSSIFPHPSLPTFPSQYHGEIQYGGQFTIASFKKNACTAGYYYIWGTIISVKTQTVLLSRDLLKTKHTYRNQSSLYSVWVQ